MTTTVSRRFVILAGSLLISLLVLATSVATSQAIITAGAGVGGGEASLTLPTQDEARLALLQQGPDRVHPAAAPAATVETASTGSTATALWIVVAVLLAALTISVWALARRRRTAVFSILASSIPFRIISSPRSPE